MSKTIASTGFGKSKLVVVVGRSMRSGYWQRFYSKRLCCDCDFHMLPNDELNHLAPCRRILCYQVVRLRSQPHPSPCRPARGTANTLSPLGERPPYGHDPVLVFEVGGDTRGTSPMRSCKSLLKLLFGGSCERMGPNMYKPLVRVSHLVVC